MFDAPLQYHLLVASAVPFFKEHGTVDLTALAAADELGFGHSRFTADVADAAQQEDSLNG